MESPIQLYYPTENRYPFDGVCRKIIGALEKRHWNCQGIEVAFQDSPAGLTTFRKVCKISGAYFELEFSRKQGCDQRLGGCWDDTAAVSKINVFGKELTLFSDESGPELFVYVGKNWEKEAHQFVHGKKIMAKAKKKPRTYLKYVGADSLPGDHQLITKRKPAQYLLSTTDLNREYSPDNDEPIYYKTNDLFKDFAADLEEGILRELENSGF